MDKKLLILITFLVFAPLFFYLLVPFLNNPDTYYFFFASCGNGSISDQPILSQIIFSWIPCSEIMYKLIPFVLLFASTISVLKTSRLLYEKHHEIAAVALFLTPSWVLMYSKFENDTFAYFTLLLALYFFVKSMKKNYWKNTFATIGLLIVSGLIWGGSFFILIALATISVPILLLGLTTMAFGIVNIELIRGSLLAFIEFNQVTENAPIIGFIILLGLNLAIVSLKKELKWPTVVVLVIAFLNVKLAWFAVPFLALSFPNLIKTIEDKKGEVMANKFVKFVTLIAIITTLASGAVMITHPFPTYEMMEAAEDTATLSLEEDLPIFNDWSHGYFIKYFGGEPSNIGSPKPFDRRKASGIVLTTKPVEDCELIKTYYRGITGAYLKLWKC